MKPCYHLNSYSAMDQSAVFLASRAFSDPEYYLSREFTASDVQDIVSFMEGTGSNRQRIKRGIRDEAVATYQAQLLWTHEHKETDIDVEVLWRYVGTKNGLYRIFPGTQMPKDYDPILRPWYEHAMANRDSNVITPPYSDAASGASVITLSRVLFEGRRNGIHDILTDEVVAVMGVDVLLSYFHKILHELYPICNDTYKCLVIDKAGYAIVADEYVSSPPNRFNEHVTQLEPKIASVLIHQGILQPVSCSNIESAVLQRTFKISDNQRRYSGTTGGYGACYVFELMPIAHTNAYLIVRSRSTTYRGCRVSYSAHCTCNRIATTCSTQWTGNYCECPCNATNEHYFPCKNDYTFSSTSPPPCTPENLELSSVTGSRVDTARLPACSKINFIVPPSKRRPVNSDDESATPVPVIVGAVVGSVLGLILLIIILVCFVKTKKKRCSTRTKPQSRNTEETIQPPATNPTAPPPYNASSNYSGFDTHMQELPGSSTQTFQQPIYHAQPAEETTV